MTDGAAALAKPQVRGNIVIRTASGAVRISDHMKANPNDIPDWIVEAMPVEQKKELGL